MTTVDRYRTLPEAHAVPDVVWDVDRAVRAVSEARAVLAEAERELEALTQRMSATLREDWTDEEIAEAGLF